MIEQIASAFGYRQRPVVLTSVVVDSTLRSDAWHFDGMDWTRVRAEDWVEHSDAFFGFSPQAFAYYLPSLLVLSLASRSPPLLVADALVSSLDTSGDPDLWDDWFCERFRTFTSRELLAIRGWSGVYLAARSPAEGSEFARVQDTLTGLELMLGS